MIENRSVQEVLGDGKVEKIQFNDGTTFNTDGVFIAIGTASSTDFARKLGAIIEENHIKVDENMATNIAGLYAAGDCTGGLLQISKAVYEGAKAALSCVKYLKEI